MKRKSIFRARTVMLLSQIYSVFVLSKTNPVIIYVYIYIYVYICIYKNIYFFMFGSLGIHFYDVWCWWNVSFIPLTSHPVTGRPWNPECCSNWLRLDGHCSEPCKRVWNPFHYYTQSIPKMHLVFSWCVETVHAWIGHSVPVQEWECMEL